MGQDIIWRSNGSREVSPTESSENRSNGRSSSKSSSKSGSNSSINSTSSGRASSSPTPGLADKIHSAQIAFEILAQIGWFGRGLSNKARLDFFTRFRKKRKTQSCPLLPAAFYKELDPTWFRKFLVQFAADLQI